MTKLRVLLPAAALLASSVAFAPVAMAASAHNLQTGAHTANANDSADDAVAKQMKLEEQSASRTPWAAFR